MSRKFHTGKLQLFLEVAFVTLTLVEPAASLLGGNAIIKFLRPMGTGISEIPFARDMPVSALKSPVLELVSHEGSRRELNYTEVVRALGNGTSVTISPWLKLIREPLAVPIFRRRYCDPTVIEKIAPGFGPVSEFSIQVSEDPPRKFSCRPSARRAS